MKSSPEKELLLVPSSANPKLRAREKITPN